MGQIGLYGTETSFGKNVSRSSAGAVGPFQFLPSTAKSMGVNPNDFRSAAFGAARYLSQYKGRGVGGMLSAYNAGPAGGYQSGYVQSTLKNAQSYGGMPGRGVSPMLAEGPPIKIPGTPARQEATFDAQGFQKAQKASLIGKLISSTEGTKDNPLIASGLATTRSPERSEFEGSRTIPGTPAQTIPSMPGGTHIGAALPKGLAIFEGKRIAGWIDPILQWAKAHGWKGSVQSGFRSRGEQEAIYNSGVRPAAKPGTSNHEGTDFPRGAVDVSNAAELARILKNSPYAGTLVWAGAKDPVHFSHPHNNSY